MTIVSDVNMEPSGLPKTVIRMVFIIHTFVRAGPLQGTTRNDFTHELNCEPNFVRMTKLSFVIIRFNP